MKRRITKRVKAKKANIIVLTARTTENLKKVLIRIEEGAQWKGLKINV